MGRSSSKENSMKLHPHATQNSLLKHFRSRNTFLTPPLPSPHSQMSKSLLSRSKPAPDLTGPEWDSSDDEQPSGGIVASKKKGKKGMGNGDVVALDVANSTKKSSFKKGKKNKKPQVRREESSSPFRHFHPQLNSNTHSLRSPTHSNQPPPRSTSATSHPPSLNPPYSPSSPNLALFCSCTFPGVRSPALPRATRL